MSVVKVTHHVKKLMENVHLSENQDQNVESVAAMLIQTYREYSLEQPDKLKATVKEALAKLDISALPATPSSDIKRVSSLNQIMSQSGGYQNQASKRQRPSSQSAEGEPIVTDESNEQHQVKKPKKKVGATSIISNVATPGTSFICARPLNRMEDFAGIETILGQIRELIFFPLKYPKLYEHLGVLPPCGILLHGPSGCGKTSLANAIAGELSLPFYKASGPELVGGTSGESEERIRQLFEAASSNAPAVIFIDALDVIAAKKDSAQRGMDRRIIAQLFDSIDLVSSHGRAQSRAGQVLDESKTAETSRPAAGHVILIAATNKPDNIDPGVRGRFSKEIALPVPNADSRSKILKLMTKSMCLSADVDFDALGKATPGYVGADLQTLSREAGMVAVGRILSQRSADALNYDATMNADDADQPSFVGARVEMGDFLMATKNILPTAKREGFAVAPDVTWNDIGALMEIREELLHNVLEPIANPERYQKLGLEVPAGVLFYGPPGCGKTLLAKALANQSGANFISVKGPELLNMYVGESESRVRQVFARARASSPCVIFFDELDALCPKRGSGGDGGGGNGVSERVVNQLLTELDGLESRKDVYIIAATNRLELIDDAMLRPGRIGKLLYVPLPTLADRASILTALTRKVAIDLFSNESESGIKLEKVAADPRADGFSGADLSALIREAGLAVMREYSDRHRLPAASAILGRAEEVMEVAAGDAAEEAGDFVIRRRHMEMAFSKVKPSVTQQDRKRYELVQQFLKEGMGAVQALVKAAKMATATKL